MGESRIDRNEMTFLFIVASLNLPGRTGSPVTPTATLSCPQIRE
jgi:hypothetical protein